MKEIRTPAIALIVLTVLFSITAVPRQANAVSGTQAILNFMCPCGSCDEALSTCECPQSDGFRGEVFGLVRKGMSEPQIIDNFVSRFGPGVLVANASSVLPTGGDGITISRRTLGILLVLAAISLGAYAWSRRSVADPLPAGRRPRQQKSGSSRTPASGKQKQKQKGRRRSREQDLDDLMDD